MPQISWSQADAPPAPPPPRRDYGQNGADQASGAAFQQAMQDVRPDADETTADTQGADVQGADGTGDDGSDSSGETGRKGKKGLGDGGLFGGLFGALPHHAAALKGRSGGDGRQGALGELGARGQGAPAPAEAPAPARGSVDLDAFADMLEQAAAQAPLAPNQTFQVALGDARSPVASVSMSRQPDGSLSMTLGTDNEAVTQVRAALDTLRRRLEARGVQLAALTAEGEPAGVQGQDAA